MRFVCFYKNDIEPTTRSLQSHLTPWIKLKKRTHQIHEELKQAFEDTGKEFYKFLFWNICWLSMSEIATVVADESLPFSYCHELNISEIWKKEKRMTVAR